VKAADNLDAALELLRRFDPSRLQASSFEREVLADAIQAI
jgi:hypothetical protein